MFNDAKRPRSAPSSDERGGPAEVLVLPPTTRSHANSSPGGHPGSRAASVGAHRHVIRCACVDSGRSSPARARKSSRSHSAGRDDNHRGRGSEWQSTVTEMSDPRLELDSSSGRLPCPRERCRVQAGADPSTLSPSAEAICPLPHISLVGDLGRHLGASSALVAYLEAGARSNLAHLWLRRDPSDGRSGGGRG